MRGKSLKTQIFKVWNNRITKSAYSNSGDYLMRRGNLPPMKNVSKKTFRPERLLAQKSSLHKVIYISPK